MNPVNLGAKLAAFSEHWQPRTIGQFNGHDLMVVKARGEFVWHKHDDTDDFFLVLKGHLTIELRGPIPEELRPLIGNRIYGCDDCQLVCPWNKYAQRAVVADFDVRNGLDSARLVDLFAWTREEFEARTAGSAIRRIGHERWLRNIAVALGNAPASPEVVSALNSRRIDPSALVRDHVEWALAQHGAVTISAVQG